MAHVFTGINGGPVLHANGGQGHLQQQHPQQPAPSFDIDMLISDPNATTSEDSEQQHAPAKCRLSDAGTSSAAGPPGGNSLWQSAGCATGDWQQRGQQQEHWAAGAAGANQAAGTARTAEHGAAATATDPPPAQEDNPLSKNSSTTAAADAAAAAAAVPAPVAPRSSDDSTAAQQQQVLQQFTLHCSSPVDGSATVATAHVDGKPQQLQFTTVAVSGTPTPDLQQPLTIQSIQPMIVADAAMLQQILQQQQQQNGGGGASGPDSKAGVMGNIPLSLPAVYDEHALQQLLQQVVASAPDTDTAIWQQPGATSNAADAGSLPAATSPSAAGKDTQLKLLHLVPLAKQLQPALPAIAPIVGGSAGSPVKQQAGSDSADAAAVANAAAAEATAAADAAVAAAASAPNAAAAAALAGNMLAAGPSGMQVFVASPAGKAGAGVLVPASMISPGVFTPGANKEELKGCCEALMMLRDLSKPGEDAGGAGHATGVIAMMPNKPGAGAAAALAAVRSTAAMAAEAPVAALLAMPGHALPPVAPLQPVPQGNSHQPEQQRGATGQGGAEPLLGRGKRVRKPQQWSQQMQLLDQLVDSVEHSGGSSADYHAHPGQQGNPAGAADGLMPAAKRQRRQLPGPGGAAVFEDDEADESYDAAADANGDEEEAAELAEYEEEIMQYDTGEDAAAGAAAAAGNGRRRSNSKRGGARGRYVPRKLKDNKAIFERTGAAAAAADADAEPMPPPLSHSWGSCSYLGVSKKRSGKWQAAVRFGHDGSYAFWCCYGCPKQAARARDAAALALRGPAAARLNFPEDTYSDAEILAAAAHILQKHPHLHPLEHPLLRTMTLADILGGGPAGPPVDTPAAPAEDSAAVADAFEGTRGVPASSSGKRSPQREGAASGASAPAAPGGAARTGGKSRMGPRHKSSTPAAAAAQAERAPQQQHHHQQQQQQAGDVSPVGPVGGDDAGGPPIDTATMFSRLFDLAALVVFGPCAATETPASAFYPEELAAAAAAMSCRMPPGGLASVQEHLQSLAQAQQEQQRLQQQQQGNGLDVLQDMAAAAEEDVPAVMKQMRS